MAAYTKTAWVNGGAPAISAANLNKIELGLENVVGLDVLADLRALPVPTTVFTARTLGFSSAGDGGGGIFWWDSSSSAADNGGTIIVPNSSPASGRWIRLRPPGVMRTSYFNHDLQKAAAAAAAAAEELYIDGTCNVSTTVNVSGISRVFGDGWNKSKILASSAQFDVLKTTGGTRFENFYLHGGWDGSTAGQSGHGINISNTSPNYAFQCAIDSLQIINCKQDGIFFYRSGYSTVTGRTRVNACGRHALNINGTGGTDITTTIFLDASCTLSDCPYGFGVRISNGHNINLIGGISEYTQGIEIAGTDNRNINIFGYYQENTTAGKFLTLTGSGLGLTVVGCFAVTMSVDYNANFHGAVFFGNAGLALPADALEWAIQAGSNNGDMSVGGKLRSSLGSELTNKAGVSPAHVFDTSILSGFSNYIAEFRNGGGARFQIDSAGGPHISGGGWDSGHIQLGAHHLWVDGGGNLRIKSSAPTSSTDGTVVGSQI